MTAADDEGGHRRSQKIHERAAETHVLSVELHEQHAEEMRAKGMLDSVERAERIAARERELAEKERTLADEQRRRAEDEASPAGPTRARSRRPQPPSRR